MNAGGVIGKHKAESISSKSASHGKGNPHTAEQIRRSTGKQERRKRDRWPVTKQEGLWL